MENMTLTQIAAACGGQLFGAKEKDTTSAKGVVIDSRQVEEGYVFVAVRGEKVDGHSFLKQIYEKKALAAIVEEVPEASVAAMGPYILVESSLQALKDIATYYRKTLNIPIIGVTGSVGKTSTKEMLASVLSEKYEVLKTEGNFNNEIGLPLTILKIRKSHTLAVVEMGISDFDEMNRLGAIAKPDIAVITNIGVCHLENLIDRDGVFRAKTEIFAHLAKDGRVVLNGDDDKLVQVETVQEKAPVFYQIANDNESIGKPPKDAQVIVASDLQNLGLKGYAFKLHVGADVVDARVHIPGEHNVKNALAAAGVGTLLGLSLDDIVAGIAKAKTIGGRTNLIEANGYLVIDDCYNANPISMKAAVDVLKLATGRKIAVLGDMGELGEDEIKLHAEVGAYVGEQKIDVLFAAGALSTHLVDAAEAANPDITTYYCSTKEELLEKLKTVLTKDDTILIKASHFMGFTDLVTALTTVAK